MKPGRVRRGRPPALDAAKIASAVRRVRRREGLTMHAVADELGVDVTTLYRHVGGVEALRQLGARLAAPSVKDWPSPEGETWQGWLAGLARYYRSALRKSPDLIEFVHSALDPDFQRLEHATRILVGFGFEPRAAGFAHGFVMNHVVGYVHQEQREAELSAQGRSAVARFVQALVSDREVGRLVTLKNLALGAADFEPDAAFERLLQYAIDGIAAQPGAPA
jgi:AcrR family transcriptional regulator